jgi:hypothetical protein
MAADIRASTFCSLGELISGELGDDYIQNNGLIKTRGSCEIRGLIAPKIGTEVFFRYSKNGTLRYIPKKMRVMSSFADPFRQTTKVELGCKLTYLSDLQEPLKWNAFDDPENKDTFSEEDQKIVTIPIRASSIALECLKVLGISYSGPLPTNKFSIAEFDFSAGYVNVLSDLLLSESLFGYLDGAEILQIARLDEASSGPYITSSEIIDIGQIGIGQLPADTVVVNYNSLKLKADIVNKEDEDSSVELPPDPEGAPESEPEEDGAGKNERINWELDTSASGVQSYFINYKGLDGQQRTAEYTGSSYSTSYTKYGLIKIEKAEPERPTDEGLGDSETWTSPEYEEKEVVVRRHVKNYGPAISIAAPFAKAYLESDPDFIVDVQTGDLVPQGGGRLGGFNFNNEYIQISATDTYYEYLNNGSTVIATEYTYKTRAEHSGSLGLDLANYYAIIGIEPNTVVVVIGIADTYSFFVSEVTVTESTSFGNTSKEAVYRYKRLSDTQHGQQAISSIREDIDTAAEAAKVMRDAFSGLYLDSSSIQTRSSGRRSDTLQTRPSPADRTNAEYSQETGNPDNDWKSKGEETFSTDGSAGIDLSGDRLAKRRIEFSMPYAPDDIFIKFGPDSYRSVESDAPDKARLFGRMQNRLLMGNRYGLNLQITPERLPFRPFSSIYLAFAGFVGEYRTNGSQWAFDSNGIICSTDAVYWGALGKMT